MADLDPDLEVDVKVDLSPPNSEAALLSSLGANLVDKDDLETEILQKLEQQKIQSQKAHEGVPENEGSAAVQGPSIPRSEDNRVGPSEPQASTSTSVRSLEAEPEETRPPSKLQLALQGATGSEETDQERKVRLGEVTPFGSGLDGSTFRTPKRDTFLNFGKYLEDQQRQQELRKKQLVKGKKGRGAEEDAGRKSKKSSRSGGKGHGHRKKDVMDMKVLFPKKRAKKEGLGLRVSDNPRDARKQPGKSLAETTSTYLNYSDDSEYVPSDLEDSENEDEGNKIKQALRSKRKALKQSLEENSSDEFSEYDSDEDRQRPKKRLKREQDDGDYKFYLNRVQQWKESETRITGEFHTFDGGFKIPMHLWESLYTYQKVGVKWLWELHLQRCGGILGDEMGLGKTIQVINFLVGVSCSNVLFRMSSYRGLGPVLLITPATVMHQWVREFHTWWPMFRVAVLHESGSYTGTKSSLIRSIAEGNGILITSYTSLANNQNEILRYNWHYMILDEGHKIRNPDAQITLAAKQIKTPHRIILSGSPLQNNLKELWSLFDFVYPGKLGTLPTFMEQFAVPITQGGYANATQVQVAVAYKCAKALRDMINPYLLRRMKSDVKDHINLPEKSEQVLFCKMTDEQRGVYKEYIDSKEINSILKGQFNLFVGLINLRKICNHPHLFDGGPKTIVANPKFSKNIPKAKAGLTDDSSEYLDLDEEGDDIDVSEDGFGHWTKSGKMIVVETLLKLWHAQGHKVLLFTQSRQMLCILENFIRQSGYSYLRLDGSTSISARQPMITKFNEDPSVFVFILTTRVGGLGVNLTAANRVILYDPDWNPSTDIQARERAWRIGQLRQVTIYRLILSGTIEEKMYHRQVFKQFLTNRVLKDPKQKRFFKSNDMVELFTLNEGTKGTESEAIFAGTGSSIKVKKSKKGKEARERTSGKFKDVPNLVKQRPAKETPPDPTEDLSTKNAEQDEYVLRKLFSKSGVHAALRHDKIVDTNEADYMIVEKEAEVVAKKAIDALKRSREQCWDAESGHANWTGNQGDIRDTPQAAPASSQPKLRFGKKKAVATVTANSTSALSVQVEEENITPESFFSGYSLFKEVETSKKSTTLSSSDLLAIIRSRNSTLPVSGDDIINPHSSSATSDIQPEQLDLLRDIREFIAFQAMVDGQATTDELIARFGPRLPSGQSPLFKEMLSQLCTFRKVEGRGIWRLKPEFR